MIDLFFKQPALRPQATVRALPDPTGPPGIYAALRADCPRSELSVLTPQSQTSKFQVPTLERHFAQARCVS